MYDNSICGDINNRQIRKGERMKLKKVYRTLTALVMVCVMFVTPVMAAPEDDRVDELEGQKAAAETELNDLEMKLQNIMNELADLEMQLTEKQQAIEQTELDLAAAEEEEEKQYDALLKRIKCMYEEGDSSAFETFFSAGSFSEALTKAEYVQKIHTYDREQLKVYQNAVQEVKDKKAQLEAEQQELLEKETAYEAKGEEYEALIADKQADIDDLDVLIQDAVRKAAEAQAAREEAARREAERLEAERLAALQQQQQNNNNNNGGNSNSGSYSKPEPSYDVVTGNAIVDRAYGWVGRADYVWGACRPGAFDCSGFVSYCLTGSYSRLGSTYTFLGWARVSNPQPGDVCVNATHCGIYIGNGQMIHAANPSVGVIIGPVPSSMIYVRY